MTRITNKRCPNPRPSGVLASSAYSDYNDLWPGAYVKTYCPDVCPSNARWWVKYFHSIGGVRTTDMTRTSNYINNRYQRLDRYTASNQEVETRVNYGDNYGAEVCREG